MQKCKNDAEMTLCPFQPIIFPLNSVYLVTGDVNFDQLVVCHLRGFSDD